MIKKTLGMLSVLAVLAGTISMTSPAVFAATTKTMTAASIAATPGYDTSRTDDDIVQVSNLKVTDITHVASVQGGPGSFAPGGTYAIVTAIADTGVSCVAYPSTTSARSMPCAPVRPAQYMIQISDQTMLLGVNRTRLAFDQVAVGDRVNVYGYFDRDSSYMEALILRDLDKPVTPKTVQIENMRVYSVNKDGNGGLELLVGTGSSTCYDFTYGAKRTWSCPMGVTASAAAEMNPSAADSISKFAPIFMYQVSVPATSQILDKNRRKSLSRVINVGDTVNVYGTLKGNTIISDVVRITNAAPVVSSVAIAGDSTANAYLNTFSRIAFTASGGTTPYQWSEGKVKSVSSVNGTKARTGMPPGMYLTTEYPMDCDMSDVCPQPMPNPLVSEAWIAGTPTRTGTYRIAIVVRDSAGQSATQYVTITVGRLTR